MISCSDILGISCSGIDVIVPIAINGIVIVIIPVIFFFEFVYTTIVAISIIIFLGS